MTLLGHLQPLSSHMLQDHSVFSSALRGLMMMMPLLQRIWWSWPGVGQKYSWSKQDKFACNDWKCLNTNLHLKGFEYTNVYLTYTPGIGFYNLQSSQPFSETPKATLSWVIAMSSNAMIIHNDSVGDYLGADKFQQWSFGMHTALCALEFIIH